MNVINRDRLPQEEREKGMLNDAPWYTKLPENLYDRAATIQIQLVEKEKTAWQKHWKKRMTILKRTMTTTQAALIRARCEITAILECEHGHPTNSEFSEKFSGQSPQPCMWQLTQDSICKPS